MTELLSEWRKQAPELSSRSSRASIQATNHTRRFGTRNERTLHWQRQLVGDKNNNKNNNDDHDDNNYYYC